MAMTINIIEAKKKKKNRKRLGVEWDMMKQQ